MEKIELCCEEDECEKIFVLRLWFFCIIFLIRGFMYGVGNDSENNSLYWDNY